MFKSSSTLRKWGLALLSAATLLSSCQKEDPPYLLVDQNAIVASQETSKVTVLVEANTTWTVSSRADWAKVYGSDGSGIGTFDIIIDANASVNERSTEVVVSGVGCTAVIAVVQSSSELTIVTPVSDYYISSDPQELTVDYLISSADATVAAFSNSD